MSTTTTYTINVAGSADSAFNAINKSANSAVKGANTLRSALQKFGDCSFAANNIKIIHEATDDTPEFVEARKYLKDAIRIFFFGFGFHPTNCRRLKLDDFFDRGHFFLLWVLLD